MHAFHLFLIKKYDLETKANLFGFSRGGLYAFNYALFYSEYVEKVYLDAPVLDMKTWPPAGSVERQQVYEEYDLNEETFQTFKGSPIDKLAEFFALNIPLMVVAGAVDSVVPFEENAGKLIDFCRENGLQVHKVVKPLCDHHPHSLDDVSPIVQFIEG
jgi:pimeloyl-ACP methyl ester carboxylesterase